MSRIVIVIVMGLWLAAAGLAPAGEVEEVQRLAPGMFPGCQIEATLYDGSRVDILTEDYAIEADWSDKWAEGVGQAVYYSVLTGRKPGLLVLVKNRQQEKVALLRATIACRQAGIRLWVADVAP